VTPAYGRDYTSAKAAKADWFAGKDFIMQPQGCYINKADAQTLTGATAVNIRYKGSTRVTVVTI
jgi:hypothetical protein